MLQIIRFLFLLLLTKTVTAQQLYVGERATKWVDYYVVEIKGDTATVENHEFDIHTQIIEKLVKTNLKDTLFSNGKTKIVLTNGKMWVYFGQLKIKLKDYTEKPEKIASIRKNSQMRIYKNNAKARLSQTLGKDNYDYYILENIDTTLGDTTKFEAIRDAFESAADSIIAREKPKVDFFKTFLEKRPLSESEIILFLDSVTYIKQIEEDVLRKIISEDIETLSQVIEKQPYSNLNKKLNSGLKIINQNTRDNKECLKALKKSTCKTKTKTTIEKRMNRANTKDKVSSAVSFTVYVASCILFWGAILF